jgi:diguanylate cyclase (GGDEF)-like protein/PAS domain S-box-containing protein
MDDNRNTKDQLIEELKVLRRRVTELEISETNRKQAEEVIQNNLRFQQLLMDAIPSPIFYKDSAGIYAGGNKALERLWGRPLDQIIGKTVYDISPPDLAAVYERVDKELLNNPGVQIYETSVASSSGIRRNVIFNKATFTNAKGEVAGLIGVIVDITERKQAEETLRGSEARYRAVTQSANDAIITANGEGTIVSWNRGAEKLFGYTEVEINGQSVIRLIPDRYRARHLAGLSRLHDGGELQISGKTVELEGLRKDGTEFPIEFSLAKWETAEGRFYTVILRDITERKRYQENLEYFAVHDVLTGLLNRRSIEDMLNRTISRAKRGTMSSLLYMDLDNFKEVNDNLGHNVGDGVLIALSGLLKKTLRAEDVLFRLGGDEFAVLLEGIYGQEAFPAAERLRLAVEAHSFDLAGRSFPLTLSIGLIQIDGILTTSALLSQADAAMYSAKEQGKNRVVQG